MDDNYSFYTFDVILLQASIFFDFQSQTLAKPSFLIHIYIYILKTDET